MGFNVLHGYCISDVLVLAEMLLAKGERGLAVEAMRELANLHYHTGNMRGAFRWWSDALDKLLGATDAIHNWRSLFKVQTPYTNTLTFFVLMTS